MEVSNIVTKISTFFGVLFASPLTIIPTILLLVFLYELFFRMNREDAKLKYFFGAGVACFILFTFVAYFSSVMTGLDSIFTGILTEYYFPSMATYMGIVVLAHLVVVGSVLKDTIPIHIKKTNIILFSMIEILFFEFLYLIGKHHLSLTTVNQIHSNQEILIVLELTTFITFVWIIIGIGFLLVRYLVPTFEKKKEQQSFPQVSLSHFDGVPLFPQENVKVVRESLIEREDIVRLKELYEEEQTLVEEQLRLMLLFQQAEYDKLSGELFKLPQFRRRQRVYERQIEAYDILLYNQKVTMEEELELLLYIKKKEQEKIEKEIDLLLQKLSNESVKK